MTLYYRPTLALDLKTVIDRWLPACDCRATGHVIDDVCWCGGAVPRDGEETRDGDPIGHLPTENRKALERLKAEPSTEELPEVVVYLDPNGPH